MYVRLQALRLGSLPQNLKQKYLIKRGVNIQIWVMQKEVHANLKQCPISLGNGRLRSYPTEEISEIPAPMIGYLGSFPHFLGIERSSTFGTQWYRRFIMQK